MVRYGWNTHMGRRKFDVEVDMSDLPRILIECGIDPGIAGTLPEKTVFTLFYNEALMLSAAAELREPELRAPDAAAEENRQSRLRAEIAARKNERDQALKPYQA